MIQKWEYVTVPLIPHATKKILDNWGSQGYELVQVVTGPSAGEREGFSAEGYDAMGSPTPAAGLVAYMKRPKSG